MAQHDPFADPTLDKYVGGVIPTPPSDRDFLYPRMMHTASTTRRNHDLRSYKGQSLVLPIADQGRVGSCTAFAWGYYLRGSLAARYHVDNGSSPDLGDTLSAGWFYDMERSPEFLNQYPTDSGADMRTGGAVLLKYGIPPERYYPYTGRPDDGPLSQVFTPERFAAAAYYGISGYYKLQGSGQTLIDSGLQCLEENYGFVMAILVYESFERTGADGRVAMPRKGEQLLGGHALFCCGNYIDASFPGGGAWLVANQWTTQFGQGGYAFIPFAYGTTTLDQQYGPILQEMWTGR